MLFGASIPAATRLIDARSPRSWSVGQLIFIEALSAHRVVLVLKDLQDCAPAHSELSREFGGWCAGSVRHSDVLNLLRRQASSDAVRWGMPPQGLVLIGLFPTDAEDLAAPHLGSHLSNSALERRSCQNPGLTIISPCLRISNALVSLAFRSRIGTSTSRTLDETAFESS